MDHSRYRRLVLAHALVMALAILWFIPIAIFAAKFFRSPTTGRVNGGDEKKLAGTGKAWKTIHIISNVIATALIIAGFTLGYYISGNSFQIGLDNAHFIIGLTFLIGILLQAISGPIMTIYNSSKGKSHRPIFNYLHIAFGYLITLLGVANIWLGLNEYGSPHYLYGLWIAAVAVWLALYVVAIPLRKRYEARQYVARGEDVKFRRSQESGEL